MKRNVIYIFICLLLCCCGNKKEQETKAPVKVETDVVAVGSGESGQTYVGVVEENEATAVSFTSMGVIKRMLVSEGQVVSRGQLIAEIDATSPSNSVEMARASASQANDMVQQAEVTYAQAKDAYDRMKILHDNGSLPEIKWVEIETRLRQAETALNTAKSNVTSAKAAENIARKGVADTRLYAPVSGVIGRRQMVVGETALPSQAVVNILDISTVKVKVSIPEDEMKNITQGTPSYITVEAINGTYNGGHVEKGVQADVVTHTYDVRINVANPGHRLLPGMVATVQFMTRGSGGGAGLYVPISAVQRNPDGKNFVWTVDANRQAHRTVVTVGSTRGNKIAILSGLNTGERVVTNGCQKLSEGTSVIF